MRNNILHVVSHFQHTLAYYIYPTTVSDTRGHLSAITHVLTGDVQYMVNAVRAILADELPTMYW